MPTGLSRLLPSFITKKLNHAAARKISKNVAWLFVDKILRAAGELTIGIWIARYLGPQDFGLFSYAIAFVSLFTAFSTLGLNKIVVRDLVQSPEAEGEILGTALGLRIFASSGIAIFAAIAILWLRPGVTQVHWLVGIAAIGLALQAFETVTFWFQAQIQAKYDVIARSSAYLVASTLKIGLIFLRASVLAFGVAVLFEVILRAIGLGIAYRAKGQPFKNWKFKFTRAKALLSSSWPLILSGLAVTIYMRIDQIMLGQMAGDEAVGIYSAAVKFSEAWYFIPVAIASSAFPVILQSKTESETVYYSQIQSLFKFIIGITYIIILSTIFLSKPLINLAYGSSYSEAALVLSIHIFSGLFVSIGVIRELWLAAENLLIFSLLCTASGAILNITLNTIFIPKYSGVGAAFATFSSHLFADYIACFLADKTRKIAYTISSALLFK